MVKYIDQQQWSKLEHIVMHGLEDSKDLKSSEVTKGAPKSGEKVNPTDPRPKIVVETVNSPELSVEEVPFDAVDAPKPAVTAAATTMAQDDYDDEDVPVRFNPPQIRTRSETRAARRFAEAAGLMGSEASVPNLFGGQPESDTAVGQILGNKFRPFWIGI
jgi:hypothetical protein